MNNSTEVALKIVETIDSLNTAVYRAGDSPIRVRELKSMSALDLIALIAPNDIVFTYEPEKT